MWCIMWSSFDLSTSHVTSHMINPNAWLPTLAFPLWITDTITGLGQLPNWDVGSTSYLGNTPVQKLQNLNNWKTWWSDCDSRPLTWIGANRQLQCQQCMDANKVCIALPKYVCWQCQTRKQKCSLIPLNLDTGRTDHHTLLEDHLWEFRIKQMEESHAELKKGKQHMLNSPDAGEPEDSGLDPLPSAVLSALGSLMLESGGSSSVNTPSNSPAILSQPSLLKPSALLPPTAPKTSGSCASKHGTGTSSLKPPVTAPT